MRVWGFEIEWSDGFSNNYCPRSIVWENRAVLVYYLYFSELQLSCLLLIVKSIVKYFPELLAVTIAKFIFWHQEYKEFVLCLVLILKLSKLIQDICGKISQHWKLRFFSVQSSRCALAVAEFASSTFHVKVGFLSIYYEGGGGRCLKC
jgi:hypothetical protein